MRIPFAHGLAHLTYCTNVHPGESWEAVREILRERVPAVKACVSPAAPMGLGLRIAADAAARLRQADVQRELAELLGESGCYLFTLNGFPYGRFHGTRVKEHVYQPDWSRPERLVYTKDLADLLAALLPADVAHGSISTVPGTFRPLARNSDVVEAITCALLEMITHLDLLREETGKTLVLALEPEPMCMLEATREAIDFIERQLLSREALGRVSIRKGSSPHEAEEAIRRHLGLCFDVCHAAVAFEDCGESLAALTAAGIRVAKLQLSCALRLRPVEPEGMASLGRFEDGVYLHQVVGREDSGGLCRFLDLEEALAVDPGRFEELRVHCHVPIFTESLAGPLSTTRPELEETMRWLRQHPVCDHLEVETYTFEVLPDELRRLPVDEVIAREIRFARSCLDP